MVNPAAIRIQRRPVGSVKRISFGGSCKVSSQFLGTSTSMVDRITASTSKWRSL
jgi:hypothetical protein